MEERSCKDCGEKLSKNEKICPNCGSKKRNTILKFEEKIELHEQLKGKVKNEGIKKPIQEFKIGDDLHRKSGEWHRREMSIDRKNNLYKETVKDKIIGETIYKCEEPLSEHKGRGSAKDKKNEKNKNGGAK